MRAISFLLAAMPVIVTLVRPEGVNPTIPLSMAIMMNVVAAKQAERVRERETPADASK